MQGKIIVSAIAICFTGFSGIVQAAEEFRGLEEIIVTASKRAETLQEAGMSVTALTELDIERMGAQDFMDVAFRVPNLGMAYEADGRFDSSSPSIRGVFGKNTTGFYIDDTPVTASVMPRVLDVARVEVLRGPQGSLYGARSMGGTIRLISKQPDLVEPEVKLHTSISTVKEGTENYNFDGSINIPIVEDKFALRVAGYFGSNSGVFDRVYQSTWVEAGSGDIRQSPGPAFDENKNVDDEEYWGGQIAAKVIINDQLSFVPTLMYQKVEADGLPFADIDPDSTTELRFFDTDEPGTDEWYVLSGTFNWDLDIGTVVSTTSYYDRKTDESEEEHTFLHFLFNEVIGIPIDPLESPLSTVEKYDSFLQEIRFVSSFDGPWQVTAGVFYQDSTWDHHYPRALQPGLADAIDEFTGAPGLGQDPVDGFGLTDDDLIFTTQTDTKTEEIAVYGELTYDITDRVSVTAGGRFYETKLDAVNTADGFANSGPSGYDVDTTESGFNPKFMVQADLSDNVNVYGSASKGFRIGGANGNLPPGLCGAELADLGVNPDDTPTYDTDKLWSYELGFKTTLADNRVSINAAVYYIDWQDIQQQNRLACGFQFIANAGEAESKGFEIEIEASPIEGLSLSLGVGYTDAKITDAAGVSGVAKGDKIQGVPDWTVTATVEYIFPIMGDWDAIVRADANYYGESFSANNESTFADARLRPDWTQLNLRAGLINQQWEITLFADNVTDERASLADSRSIAAEAPFRQRLVVTRPRTIGLEARVRF